MKKPEQLSSHALQMLARQYSEVERAIKDQQKLREEIREELLLQVEHYGAAAPKSDKTFRLESVSYIIDVTQSESLAVDDAAVQRLATITSTRELSQLFESKSYYVKRRGAESAVTLMVAKVRNAFRKCFVVKPAAPKLSVKAKEEKQKPCPGWAGSAK